MNYIGFIDENLYNYNNNKIKIVDKFKVKERIIQSYVLLKNSNITFNYNNNNNNFLNNIIYNKYNISIISDGIKESIQVNIKNCEKSDYIKNEESECHNNKITIKYILNPEIECLNQKEGDELIMNLDCNSI